MKIRSHSLRPATAVSLTVQFVLALALHEAAIGQELSGGPVSPRQISTSGFVDFYYSRNFDRPESRANKFRNFDISENQFNLSLAELVVQERGTTSGFRLDMDFGSANDLVESGTTSSLTYVQQAYLTAVLPIGNGITVDAGKFVTHMGYEVIESKDNWNYSRSLLFSWAIPYYHVGLRASYRVDSALTLSGYVYNGWNTITAVNDAKTLGATVNYAVLPSTSLIANWIGGAEQPVTADAGHKNVFEIILVHQLNDDMALALNADYGEERLSASLVKWMGVAAYGRLTLNKKSAASVRLEVFSDPQGYATGVGMNQDLKELTATYEYKFADALAVRAEFRHDWSNIAAFDSRSGINVQKHQSTILVGTVFAF